jgi:cytochrome c oxidase subunit 2
MKPPCTLLRKLTWAALLLLCACRGPQDYLRPLGPELRVATLGNSVLIGFSIVAVTVTAVIAWVAFRRRGDFSEHAPIAPDVEQQGLGTVKVWGIVFPVLTLLVTFAFTLRTMAALPSEDAPDCLPGSDTTSEIHVYGRQWWFEIQYTFPEPYHNVTTATELHIPVGRPVTIALESRDVIHSFWVPKLHGKVDMLPGQAAHVRLQASQAGVFEGECAEYCGAQHAHMRLRVIAEPLPMYEAWLEAQRKPAPEPTEERLALGRRTLESTACGLCHTVRGTSAHGQVGPDLTHVASRGRIAGGAFPNDTATLAAWMVHAQDLKPGALMPDLPQLSGEQLTALTAYLQNNH